MLVQSFQLNTRIVFGVDSLQKLPEEGRTLGEKVIVVAGRKALLENGVLNQLQESLTKADFKVTLFAEVEPEPSLTTVAKGLRLAREVKADWVIGIGGGSAMDAAKAIAGLYGSLQPVEYYFENGQIEEAGIPLVTIPTTAGSGAEVTINAVLTDTNNRVKRSIRDLKLAAKICIIDPRLTVNNPPNVTVSSGMDALVQAIEAYTSKGANDLTDIYAYSAIERIGAYLVRAYQNPQDLEARSAMALGSLMAGIAFANARLGAVHGLAHPVGVATNQPHGLVCAVLLVPVMRFNLAVCHDKYAKVAQALGYHHTTGDSIDAAAAAIKAIMSLQKKLGIPPHISDLGLKQSDLQEIVAESLPSGSLKANPRTATAADLLNILKEGF